MEENCLTCGICGYKIDKNEKYWYDKLKKLGNFSCAWVRWIVFIFCAIINAGIAILFYLALSKKYCPDCKTDFYRFLKRSPEEESDNSHSSEEESEIFEISNDCHLDISDDVVTEIDDLIDTLNSIDGIDFMWDMILEKYNESDGNLLELEKAANKITKFIDSQNVEFNDTQSMIVFLSIILNMKFDNDEATIYITFLIVKFLWTEHRNIFKKKNNSYVLDAKIQMIIDKDNIFDDLDDYKCNKTYWIYLCSEPLEIENCYFLSAFISDDYANQVCSYLEDLTLPLSWNENSFEEFIKIINSRNDVSNLKEDYTNYYKILNLDSDATISEIKKAYKDLIAKYHPDVCKETNADKKTIELNKAYEILSDVKLKKEYDEMYF